MNKKIEQIVNKKLVVESQITSVDEINKTATFVLSTSDVDRHGDVIEQKSWQLDNFLANPVFLEQHKSQEMPLGKFTDVSFEPDPNNEGADRLVGTAKFAADIYDRAKLAFDLVKDGYVRTVSVGFIPHDIDYNEDAGVFIMKDCELLEVSLVSVPANSMALVKAQANGFDLEAWKGEPKRKAEVREDIIKAKKAVDSIIKATPETMQRNKQIMARHLLNKVIRKLK